MRCRNSARVPTSYYWMWLYYKGSLASNGTLSTACLRQTDRQTNTHTEIQTKHLTGTLMIQR